MFYNELIHCLFQGEFKQVHPSQMCVFQGSKFTNEVSMHVLLELILKWINILDINDIPTHMFNLFISYPEIIF